MERQATQPLNLEEAKARLRAAASRDDMVSWVWPSLHKGVVIAFILGLAVGTSSTARNMLASGVVSLLTRSRR